MELSRSKTGLEQALDCLAAMQGQDRKTRFSLWRAAKRFSQRDKVVARAGTGENRLAPTRGDWEGQPARDLIGF